MKAHGGVIASRECKEQLPAVVDGFVSGEGGSRNFSRSQRAHLTKSIAILTLQCSLHLDFLEANVKAV